MRKAGIIAAIVVALIVIALLAIPAFVNVNSYRPQVEAEAQKQLGRPVSLGTMHLRLLPPSIRVDGFSIGENPAFGSGKFATAQELYVSAKFWPLLFGNVEIDSLELRQPRIQLIRNREGVWNFSTLGAQNAQKQPAAAKQGGAPAIPLENLSVTDGTISVTDLTRSPTPAVYNHIDASVRGFAPDHAFNLKIAANLPGNGNQSIRLSGRAGPIQTANLIQTPFSGTLRLNNVVISGLQQFLNVPALQGMDGVLTGSTDVNNDNGKLSSRGALTLKDAVIHSVKIGYPITADYRITDDLSQNVLNIEKGDLKLGSTPLSISGTLNTAPTPAQIDVNLRASDVSISEAARLAAAFGVAFNPGTQVSGRFTADIHAQGPATQPSMEGSASARDLVINGGDLPEPVKVQSIDLTLTPQQIRSNQFKAVSGSTAVGVQFALSQYTTSAPQIDASLNTANAQISELLGIARGYGVTAVNGISGSGTISLDLHAQGPVKNTAAMQFSGTSALRNASLHLPALTQPLNVNTADMKFTSNSATISNLAASLGSSQVNGNMTLQDFSAPRVQFTLHANQIDVGELQRITAGISSAPAQKSASVGPADFWAVVPSAEAKAPAPTPSDTPLLTRMSGSGTLTAGTLKYDELVLSNLRSQVKMARGVVTLSPVTAQLYGGQETGDITANLNTTPMLVGMNLKLSNVRANDLLSSTTSLKNTIYGLLAANSNLRFSAASAADIARTLNGTASLNLADGRIAKIDLINQLAQVGKFLGVRKSAQAMTNFAKLAGTFNVNNGIAQTNNLEAIIDGGSLAAAGTVNLVNQALDLHLVAVLDKNITQQVGGTGIGGFMQTALANSKGELVMPVLVTGTFDNPHFAPDLQKIAEMKMKNLLPSVGNPSAGVSGIVGSLLKGSGAQKAGPGGLGGILGALTGQQQQQQQQQQQPQANQPNQQQQQQANPLNQLFNSVLGGKKKQQQQQQQQQQQNKPPQ